MNIGDVALAYWRLEKWVNDINVERKTAATSSLRIIKKYLDDNGIVLKDYIGHKYDAGFAIDVIGITTESSIPEEELVVSETLIPLILENGEVLKYGQVMLGEAVKITEPNNELPPDPEKAINILVNYISQYCRSYYKEKKIATKLKRCNEKLQGQLKRIRSEERKK